MSTHNMFLWRNKQTYALIITKYPPYLFPVNLMGGDGGLVVYFYAGTVLTSEYIYITVCISLDQQILFYNYFYQFMVWHQSYKLPF